MAWRTFQATLSKATRLAGNSTRDSRSLADFAVNAHGSAVDQRGGRLITLKREISSRPVFRQRP